MHVDLVHKFVLHIKITSFINIINTFIVFLNAVVIKLSTDYILVRFFYLYDIY